jgi:hypothetical protein
MNRQGYWLHLSNVNAGTWRATFSRETMTAAEGFGTGQMPWARCAAGRAKRREEGAGRDTLRPRPWLAPRVLDLRPMPHELSRRCVVWVSPAVLHAASELAELVGLDVDSFVAMLVLELHEQQLSDSRMQAGGVAASGQRSNGRVIPLGLRGKQRGRSQARMR